MHVKTLDKAQNGRQVYRALHKVFFGGNKVLSMTTAILSQLRALTYTGNSKNYNFDKYVTNHVAQHNLSASLIEFGGVELDEMLKIDFFMTGIQCHNFDATKASIATNPDRFTDFDSVKNQFIDFRRLHQASKPSGTARTVAAVAGHGGNGGRTIDRGRGAGQGGGRGSGHGRSDGQSTYEAHIQALPSQAEIDACTHIRNKHYPDNIYEKFTDAKKQKLWQLKNPGKVPGTGDNKKTAKVSAVRFAPSTNADESDDNKSLFSDYKSNPGKNGGKASGRNSDNPALKCPKTD